MNTTSSNTVSSSLLAAPSQLNRWVGLFLWTAGNVDCVGNMLVYSSRTFRQRAYSVYLLAEALSGLIYFDFLMLTRILQRGFQISITTRFDAICKLRQFDSVYNAVVSLNFLSFAFIDRICSVQRSNAYRRWSNRVDLAYKLCPACLVFWLVFFGHRLILYGIRNGQCGPQAGSYTHYDSYVEAGFTAMGVPITMIILGSLLLRSARGVIHRRIVPVNGSHPIPTVRQSYLQKIDSQLTRMLLLQTLIAVTTRIPYAAQVIYANVTQTWPKSAVRIAIEAVLAESNLLVSYIFFTSSFYISVIMNRGFRRQLKKFLSTSATIEATTA